MKKKKKDYDLLCYFSLGILIILLLLPVGLRLFGKNLYVKKNIQKDVVLVLTCSKGEEIVSSTFMNGKPYNLDYKIKGDYTIKSTDTVGEVVNLKPRNQLMLLIQDYAKITYDAEQKMTDFNVNMSTMEQTKDYVGIFNTIDNQKQFFNNQAYYCSTYTH